MTSTASEVIFPPQANHNFSRILADLKRSNLSIGNRLRSIQDDASFVADVADALRRPLIANERCGSWYVEPGAKAGSAYFKSTDGHTGQWKFSTRRLNTHLLKLVGAHDGCVVVDSTRRGKRMPDALSKTVPIWCSVLNHALFPERPAAHRLYTPPQVVSGSEHAQMEARIPAFAESLHRLGLDLEGLRAQLRKPLRPVWITQDSSLMPADEIFADFHPVVCCTSSRSVAGGEMSEGGYIQGAGDDTENWAHGLTPPVFWQHSDILLSAPEADLPGIIASLVEEHSESMASTGCVKRLAPGIFVGPLSAATKAPWSVCDCVVTLVPQTTDANAWVQSCSHIEVGIGKHKLASRNLRSALPQICSFVCRFLSTKTTADDARVYVLCETGKDISVGVALALLCQCLEEDGSLGCDEARNINKNVIKAKLGRIMTVYPEANPSRATLQSINSFLMG